MEHILKRVNQLRTKLLSVMVFLGLAIVLTVPLIASTMEEKKRVVEQLQHIQQITGDIVYLDEVLTMSARMYAYSQKKSWISRYNDHAEKLDAKLILAENFDPLIKNAIQLTSEANNKLIAIETRSFELVDKGQISEATDILSNEEYQALKKQYQENVLQSLTDVKAKTQNKLDELDNFRTTVLNVVLALLSLAFLGVWIYLVRYFKYSDHSINELMLSLNTQINKLDKSKKELTVANEAKDRFLANVSHEIRTPMNSIYGTLQLLKDSSNLEKKSLVDNALISAKALLSIINDILDISKIESNMITLEHSSFSAKKLAETVVAEQLLTVKDKAVDVSLKTHEGFNDGWIGDPTRVRQIMTNLINNAIKFTEEGSVSVELLNLSTLDGECLTLRVSDTGIGMSEETITLLFNTFSQADKSMTRKQGGIGLGMTITASLVSLMKGTIDVDSELGKGTTFTVTLPLVQTEQVIEEQDIAEPEVPDLNGKKILVVEDNRINQTIIKKMLMKTNATIDIADNGAVAVEKFGSVEPDIVLMDIQMPEMDGVEACKRIRKLNQTVPILAVTANVLLEDVHSYLSTGFTGHLGKPLEAEQLYLAIKKQLTKIEQHSKAG